MPINAAHGNFREPASDDWDIERRLTGPEYGPADGENEFSLRPRNFDEYVGQDAVKENLSVFIAAARERGDCLDHVLLHGPPGLGKTTLSCIIASELGVNLKITSGPAIEKAGDLAALLTTLNRNDVLFIDEIHRLPRAVEEVLYPAMEDFALDLMMGKGPSARSIRIPLQPFTLIGETKRSGQLSSPLRDRFGMLFRLELYTPEELAVIVTNSAGRLATPITPDGAAEIARRSRGTPRIANRFLRRVRDFAQVMGDGTVDGPIARKALTALNVVAGAGRDRPPHADDDRQELFGRPRRAGDARRRHRRGIGHAGGRVRALPPAARLPQPHAARPLHHARRLRAHRPAAAARKRRRRTAMSGFVKL